MGGVDLNADIVLVTGNVHSSMASSSTVEEHGPPDADATNANAAADTAEAPDEGGEILFPWEWSVLVWEELFNSFAVDPSSLHIVHYHPGSGIAAIPALKRKFTYSCAAGRQCLIYYYYYYYYLS